ncbi:unnamed protein product [Didymodactylos carnosus]|uniref:Uncharacterized protein n=1 Tax=Didymodactylos carnosus TaxID=1234261 RepID=A0A815C224_9BILA|nr:unnamed protein product [Didymodactylos carnosus]CAF1278010.1 unnamed protein product [Didymodactylos carnosus]CAF3819468.1 unnamed protein product [Didymodactylos carnosus]CAF4071219.1 unnamed protein product [Didymodactylos carnosus]
MFNKYFTTLSLLFLCTSIDGNIIRGRIILPLSNIKLPSTARLLVEVQDTTMADEKTITLGRQQIENLQQFSINYEIEYQKESVKPSHQYSMSARITLQKQLLFINDENINADIENGDNPLTVDIPVVQVSEVPDDQSQPPPFTDEPSNRRWRELVGKTGEYAMEVIKRAGFTNVVIVQKDTPLTMDYRPDRVRIFVDDSGIVNQIPQNG